jgi:hypothetical protein
VKLTGTVWTNRPLRLVFSFDDQCLVLRWLRNQTPNCPYLIDRLGSGVMSTLTDFDVSKVAAARA